MRAELWSHDPKKTPKKARKLREIENEDPKLLGEELFDVQQRVLRYRDRVFIQYLDGEEVIHSAYEYK